MTRDNEQNTGQEITMLLLKEEMRIEELGQFKALHQAAFRLAFDFLMACFPPKWEQEYWDAVLAKYENVIESNKANRLVFPLVDAVYQYLGEIVKDIPRPEA